MKLKYRPDRNRWEMYISTQIRYNIDLYGYCWEAFGPPSLDNGWDTYGGWFMFSKDEYVTAVKLRFGL